MAAGLASGSRADETAHRRRVDHDFEDSRSPQSIALLTKCHGTRNGHQHAVEIEGIADRPNQRERQDLRLRETVGDQRSASEESRPPRHDVIDNEDLWLDVKQRQAGHRLEMLLRQWSRRSVRRRRSGDSSLTHQERLTLRDHLDPNQLAANAPGNPEKVAFCSPEGNLQTSRRERGASGHRHGHDVRTKPTLESPGVHLCEPTNGEIDCGLTAKLTVLLQGPDETLGGPCRGSFAGPFGE